MRACVAPARSERRSCGYTVAAALRKTGTRKTHALSLSHTLIDWSFPVRGEQLAQSTNTETRSRGTTLRLFLERAMTALVSLLFEPLHLCSGSPTPEACSWSDVGGTARALPFELFSLPSEPPPPPFTRLPCTGVSPRERHKYTYSDHGDVT